MADHPKLCPICGSQFKEAHEFYCEYECGSAYNYERVVVVRAPKKCQENVLKHPATEFLYHGLDRAADAVNESLNEEESDE